ncbi:hypothetical protein AMECASPLE_027751 [Ameca splendens]|uniref:Uncharacterized protein n=1 Tax=Ameca splendens TaxID=208324 RepID=A0ABV0XI93_9TELE
MVLMQELIDESHPAVATAAPKPSPSTFAGLLTMARLPETRAECVFYARSRAEKQRLLCTVASVMLLCALLVTETVSETIIRSCSVVLFTDWLFLHICFTVCH